jgi:hypothetical protein
LSVKTAEKKSVKREKKVTSVKSRKSTNKSQKFFTYQPINPPVRKKTTLIQYPLAFRVVINNNNNNNNNDNLKIK